MSCFEVISLRKSAARPLRKRIEVLIVQAFFKMKDHADIPNVSYLQYGRQVSFGELQHFNTDSSGTTVHVTGIFAKVSMAMSVSTMIEQTSCLGSSSKKLR
jgi:hypothetical protein